MDTLIALDTRLFLFINHLPHTPFLNAIALLFSGIGAFGIIWILLGMFLFLREEQRDRWFFAPIIVGIAAAWATVELILKPLIARPRPDIALGAIVVQDGIAGFSFPSGHAAIAWAMMTVLSHYEPRFSKWFFLLATLISLSRMYVGVHYPSDVFIGGLIGWSIGTVALGVIKHPHRAKRVRR